MYRFLIFILSFFYASSLIFAQKYIVLFSDSQEKGTNSLLYTTRVNFELTLKAQNKDFMQQLTQWLVSQGKEEPVVQDLWLIKGASLSLSTHEVEQIKKLPWVSSVIEDRTKQYISPVPHIEVRDQISPLPSSSSDEPDPDAGSPPWWWGLERIGLLRAREKFPKIDGSGITVGVLDTGIQARHSVFMPKEVGEKVKKIVFKDFVNYLPYAYDDHGHGTHVSGTIAGKNVGIAIKADLVVAKVFTASGSGTDSSIIKGMQWLFNPDGDPATKDYPLVVNNSWGSNADVIDDLANYEPFRRAIQTWIKGGIVPVFAAGNTGIVPNGMPGGFPESLAVGATQYDGTVAEFSSRGPNLWKNGSALISVFKPDLSAPGHEITSAFPGNKYATWSGTSMATPHVTGALALLLQDRPNLSYIDIKILLLKSVTGESGMSFGHGHLDIYNLLHAHL